MAESRFIGKCGVVWGSAVFTLSRRFASFLGGFSRRIWSFRTAWFRGGVGFLLELRSNFGNVASALGCLCCLPFVVADLRLASRWTYVYVVVAR